MKAEAILAENPFSLYTARVSHPPKIDLPSPRKKPEEAVHRALTLTKRTNQPYMIPILGEAGYGKTHFFWTLKEIYAKDVYVTYVPPPASPDNVLSHFYFALVQAHGLSLLNTVAEKITSTFSSLEDALIKYAGPGAAVVAAFYALKDSTQRKMATRWLTGISDPSESQLNTQTILDNEEFALAALKIISQNINQPILFFVDELEYLFVSLGAEAELRLLESIKRVYNEVSNFIIVLACLTQLWDKIIDLSNTSVQSRFERPALLKRFTSKEIYAYVEAILTEFWLHIGLEPNGIWPMTDGDIESAYAFSHGNPREAIKWLKNKLEERKLVLLEAIAEKSRLLKVQVEQVRDIINQVKDQITGLTMGVFSRGFGAFILLSRGETARLLLAIPPATPHSQQYKQFCLKLQDVATKEDYDQIIAFGEGSENNQFVWLDPQDKEHCIETISNLIEQISKNNLPPSDSESVKSITAS